MQILFIKLAVTGFMDIHNNNNTCTAVSYIHWQDNHPQKLISAYLFVIESVAVHLSHPIKRSIYL